jgi:hypothetical protein
MQSVIFQGGIVEVQLSKDELIKWLKTVAGATLLSVSLAGQLDTIKTNISSPTVLANALEQESGFLGNGPYLVQYHEPHKDQHQNIPFTTFALAITFKAELAQEPGKYIGGYDRIMEVASKYDYISKMTKEPYGLVGHILVSLPVNPMELESLKQDLDKNSIVYVFPDGSGTINESNLKMGKGLYI